MKRDYSHLSHVLHAGEEVVFISQAYSPKEGVTRFWFRNVATGDTNVWHAFDDQTTEADLNATFEAITGA